MQKMVWVQPFSITEILTKLLIFGNLKHFVLEYFGLSIGRYLFQLTVNIKYSLSWSTVLICLAIIGQLWICFLPLLILFSEMLIP